MTTRRKLTTEIKAGETLVIGGCPHRPPVAENTDHGQRTVTLAFIDAQIANFPISASGDYTVSVLSEDGNPGEFAITVSILR